MNNNERDLIIGIDFGTSTTVISYKFEGDNAIQKVRDSNKTKSNCIPTLVAYETNQNGKKTYYYGSDAESKINSPFYGDKYTPVRNFKMRFKDNRDSDSFKERESIIKKYFKFLYELINNKVLQDGNFKDVHLFLSVPAKWKVDAYDTMRTMFYDAGFSNIESESHRVVITVINEPRAALYQLLATKWNTLQNSRVLPINRTANCLLLDMGAGTSDICMFQIQMDVLDNGRLKPGEIINLKNYPQHDDPNHCGGAELDVYFRKFLRDRICEHFNISSEIADRYLNLSNVKYWKENNLSRELADDDKKSCTTISDEILRAIASNDQCKPLMDSFLNDFHIGRSRFEEATRKHWNNLNNIILNAVRKYSDEYKISAADIDFILLTGGHSSWYCVKNLFNGEGISGNIGISNGFEKIMKDPSHRILYSSEPSETVSEGMCMQDMELKIPTVLTNDIKLKLKINEEANSFITIASAGTLLPATGIEITTPAIKIQRDRLDFSIKNFVFDVSLYIYEGENINNGDYDETTFTHDDNGVLKNIWRILLGMLKKGVENISFQVKFTFDIMEDQQRLFKGQVLMNDKVLFSFTEKDFQKINSH